MEEKLTLLLIANATNPSKSSEGIETDTVLSPNWVPPFPVQEKERWVESGVNLEGRREEEGTHQEQQRSDLREGIE